MPDTTPTANMGLELPIPSQALGPQWATYINTALTQVDQHTHAPGAGIPVGTNGLNINADLSFNEYNATSLKTVRFAPLGGVASSGTDVGCIYVFGQDLYYRDTTGRNVQITQLGSVISSSGNIQGLAAPARVNYNVGTGTFVFQSSATVAAKIDVGDILLRSILPNSPAITLQASCATQAYTLLFPTSAPLSNQTLETNDGSGTLRFGAKSQYSIATKTSFYQVTPTDEVLFGNTNNFQFKLPLAATVPGKTYKFIKIGTDFNPVIISSSGADVLRENGSNATTGQLAVPDEKVEYVSDGSGTWYLTNRCYPQQQIAYTPTFTGLGTVTNISAFSRRNGDMLQVFASVRTGIVTATTASMSIGFGGINNSVGIDVGPPPNYKISSSANIWLGKVITEQNTAIANLNVCSDGASTGVVFFGTNAAGSSGGLSPQSGSGNFGSNSKHSFVFQVPISGWV